jgi:hypothetical protein
MITRLHEPQSQTTHWYSLLAGHKSLRHDTLSQKPIAFWPCLLRQQLLTIFNHPRIYIQLKKSFSVRYATSSIPDETIAHSMANIRKDAWDPNLEANLWMLLWNIHLQHSSKLEREIIKERHIYFDRRVLRKAKWVSDVTCYRKVVKV